MAIPLTTFIVQNDAELAPKFRLDGLKFELYQKQETLKRLNRELVVVSQDTVDHEGVKRANNLKQKLEILREKYDNVEGYQETLRYIMDRDLKSLLK